MSFWNKLGLGLKKTSDKLTSGITEVFSKKRLDAETLEELEEILLSNDLGISATSTIMAEFGAQKQDREISETEVRERLALQIEKILQPCEKIMSLEVGKPCVILMVGVNGAGKTTTIGKLAAKFKQQGKQISFIAADTFRAAAVEQLSVWAERNNIFVFKGASGCDSAGLCYDGLNAAIKRSDDVVFIDTAGRLQNKSGLMDELHKIIRVIKKVMPDAPQHILLTLDATTGQNALDQVQIFKECADVSGLLITKLDGSAKGGVVVAIAAKYQLPIYYIGVGEQIDDLDVFKAHEYARRLTDLSL